MSPSSMPVLQELQVQWYNLLFASMQPLSDWGKDTDDDFRSCHLLCCAVLCCAVLSGYLAPLHVVVSKLSSYVISSHCQLTYVTFVTCVTPVTSCR
jgi:hypothetical protein